MDLRETIGRLTTHRCTWTAEEVAALAEVSLCGVRKYLTALTRQKVLTLTGDQYSAGPQARAWRNQPRKSKGPATYGNSAKYRATRALWDTIRQRDWKAAREQKGAPVLTSHDDAPASISTQEEAGVGKTAKTISGGRSLTYQEVANELQTSVDTVRREVRRGRLQSHTVGLRGVRISQAALEQYRTANLTNAEAKA